MLATTNSTAASSQSPLPICTIAAVLMTPTPRKIASRRFFAPAKSAYAPSTGAMIATMASASVVAVANRSVATAGGRLSAATDAKYTGKTAVMMVHWKAELAQS